MQPIQMQHGAVVAQLAPTPTTQMASAINHAQSSSNVQLMYVQQPQQQQQQPQVLYQQVPVNSHPYVVQQQQPYQYNTGNVVYYQGWKDW